MNKISYFWKIKTKETVGHAYAYTRMQTHAQALRIACFMHVYTYTDMCTHVKVPETKKDKFLCIKDGFWNESHIVWESFQTFILSQYKGIHSSFSKHKKS